MGKQYDSTTSRNGNHPGPAERPEPHPLTERQLQLLPMVCRGFSNREIAVVLGVGVDDVEYLVSELIGRTGSRNRTQLAAWATERGLSDSGVP